VTASVTVTNTGARDGVEVPQFYLTRAAGEPRQRLIGFARIALKPGESKRVQVTADPRLLARFDGTAKKWRIAAGAYQIAAGQSASDMPVRAEVRLNGQLFGQ
jgi:beta-glucosidase